MACTDTGGIISFCLLKPRPWGIKGENVNFLPSLSPAAKSFTPFIGVYIAQYLFNRGRYYDTGEANTRLPMSGFKIAGVV